MSGPLSKLDKIWNKVIGGEIKPILGDWVLWASDGDIVWVIDQLA